MENTLIIGISSGIGSAIAERLSEVGHKVSGTTRKGDRSSVEKEGQRNIYYLDISKKKNIKKFLKEYQSSEEWDNLIVCPGKLEPIVKFESCDIQEWSESFEINFTNQIILLHGLIKARSKEKGRVIFFAGGGTNSATPSFSAYTTAKIALIKIIELLDDESENMTYTILGPGWVKTKIHEQSMDPKNKALDCYKETKRRMEENDFGDMGRVVESIMWILSEEKSVVGGRNFSTVHDKWGTEELREMLLKDENAYKLRRYANSRKCVR